MNARRWARIRELYARLADRPEAEQAAGLARACGDDEELREQVARLIALPTAPEAFIEPPPRTTERRTARARVRREAGLTLLAIAGVAVLTGAIGWPRPGPGPEPRGRLIVRLAGDDASARARAWPLAGTAPPASPLRAVALDRSGEDRLEAELPAGPYRVQLEDGARRAEFLRSVPDGGAVTLAPGPGAARAGVGEAGTVACDGRAAPGAGGVLALDEALVPVDLLQAGEDGSGAGIRVVPVPALRIERAPVGNAEYLAFVRATGAPPPASWSAEPARAARRGEGDARGRDAPHGPDRTSAGPVPADGAALDETWARAPVTGVGLEPARTFAEWSGARLPTLAERLHAQRVLGEALARPAALAGELVDGPCLVEDGGRLRDDPARAWAVPYGGAPAARVDRKRPPPGLGLRLVRPPAP